MRREETVGKQGLEAGWWWERRQRYEMRRGGLEQFAFDRRRGPGIGLTWATGHMEQRWGFGRGRGGECEGGGDSEGGGDGDGDEGGGESSDRGSKGDGGVEGGGEGGGEGSVSDCDRDGAAARRRR